MATSIAENQNDVQFDVRAVNEYFAASLIDADDVDMDNYLTAYKEIYKFFDLLGSVFGFVGNDVKAKLKIMDDFRSGSDRDKFQSIKTMILYEKEAGLLVKKGYVSGCRTLLRLHRGLDFLRGFLNRIQHFDEGEKTHEVCQGVYNATLANFHPWLIRKGASLAMYSLPTREVLLQKVCGSEEAGIQLALELLPSMLKVTAETYDRTEKLYEDNKLHDLP